MSAIHAELKHCSPRGNAALSRPQFSSEQSLVQMIQALFAGSSADWAWIDELDSLNGIADLVVAHLTPGWQTAAAIGRLHPRWVYALKLLPHDAFRTSEFATKATISISHAGSILTMYEDAGFCAYERSEKLWRKIAEPSPVAQRIVAIEAKLRDWKRALFQACRYADYASQSWVVLDRKSLGPASFHIDRFVSRGVGLLGICPDGHVEILHEAPLREPRFANRFWYANTLIARRLGQALM